MRCAREAWRRRSSRSGPRSLPGFARHERSPGTRWAPSPRSLPRAGSSACTSPVMNRRPRLLSRFHASRRRCHRRKLTSPRLGGACVIRYGRPCWCPAALKSSGPPLCAPGRRGVLGATRVATRGPARRAPSANGAVLARGTTGAVSSAILKPWARAIVEADSEMPDGTGHQRRPGLRVGRF